MAMKNYIKEIICPVLKDILAKWDRNDVAIAEYILIYANNDEVVQSMFNYLFSPESNHPLRNELSLTTLKRWCIKLEHNKSLTTSQRDLI